MRWLLAFVLAGYLVTAGSASHAAQNSADFISAMTVTLAVNPAAAIDQADRELARHQGQNTAGSSRLAAAHWVKAQARFRLGDAIAARRELALARRFAPAGSAGRRVLAYVSLLEGLLARGDGDLATALTMFRRAQQNFISVQDQRGHALSLQSLGALYNDAGNADEAVRYFTIAESIYNDDDVFKLSLNNNLGVALQKLLRFSDSQQRLQMARESALRLGIVPFVQQIGLNIAANQAFAGQLNSASIALSEFEAGGGAKTDWQRSEVHRIRAIIAWRRNNRDLALAEVRKSLRSIDSDASDTSFWPMHHAAFQIFDAYGLRAEAYVQLQAVRRLEQAEAELTASNRAALLSAQFQFAAQDTQIAQLKADSLEREVSFQRTMTITIVIGALLALTLLTSLLVIAIRARNRARADGAELAEVNQRLETALAVKTEFLASTSHELRTPLNGILGMAQILLADAAIAPRHRTQIELLRDAGSTMRALVDDILDVAKIEHGGFSINPRPTDVAEVARRVVRLFGAQAATAGLTLDANIVDPLPQVMIDPERLTQILFNLVGNAIKFTPEGMVEVSVWAEHDGSPRLNLKVRDSGIGIAPEWHDAVFDMFRQVDGARTRNYGGTGLGLAICRQLARAMGGDIALESAAGEGSSFTVSLPLIALSSLPEPSRLVPVVGHGVPGEVVDAPILIVANDPMRVAMLSAIVRRSGVAMAIADSAERISVALETGKSLTLLVDVSAWAMAEPIIDGCTNTDHRILLIGDRWGEAKGVQIGSMTAEIVAFSRNAIVAAVKAATSTEPPLSAKSLLPATADGSIAPEQARLEPKRSASMSRK
jgi:signal transduction histidine kinase